MTLSVSVNFARNEAEETADDENRTHAGAPKTVIKLMVLKPSRSQFDVENESVRECHSAFQNTRWNFFHKARYQLFQREQIRISNTRNVFRSLTNLN